MDTVTQSIAKARVTLRDVSGIIWTDPDLTVFYNRFIEELNRRNPHYGELSITFGDEWNNSAVNFILSHAFGANSDDAYDRKRWEDHLLMYKNEMDTLSLIK